MRGRALHNPERQTYVTRDGRSRLPAGHCSRAVALGPLPDGRGSDWRRRSGFSLIELMIAIVILGLGLVMIATVFPIAWQRARELSEFTTESAVTDAAHTEVSMLLRVDGLESTGGSFAGDLIVEQNPTQIIVAYSDTRVHPLNLGNVRMVDRGFYPPRDEPWNAAGAPWLLDRVALGTNVDSVDEFCGSFGNTEVCTRSFLSPQVIFESRVYPPLRPRKPAVTDAAGKFLDSDPKWDESLDGRRFAWAVFHRLRERVGPCKGDPTEGPKALAAVDDPREFDVFYVTLKRSQSTYRYAQQDPESAPDPMWDPQCPLDDTPTAEPVEPKALGPDEDLMLPVPWLVQVYFPEEPSIAASASPIGVPTEVEVNTDKAPSADFVVDLFPSGSSFIDEVSGLIFKVGKRRLQTTKGGNPRETAYLTLDREVYIEEIDVNGDGLLSDWELLRPVWVFPPPVDGNRADGDDPTFVGKHPVVGLNIRTLRLTPPG